MDKGLYEQVTQDLFDFLKTVSSEQLDEMRTFLKTGAHKTPNLAEAMKRFDALKV